MHIVSQYTRRFANVKQTKYTKIISLVYSVELISSFIHSAVEQYWAPPSWFFGVKLVSDGKYISRNWHKVHKKETKLYCYDGSLFLCWRCILKANKLGLLHFNFRLFDYKSRHLAGSLTVWFQSYLYWKHEVHQQFLHYHRQISPLTPWLQPRDDHVEAWDMVQLSL